ncbi:hypothetical protein [Streptomyces scopuliridis]|uniref:hypothetical protein n=1 Tax=Streptomyces scopuliridis TaxID=452529 RepID=UPI00342E9B6F
MTTLADAIRAQFERDHPGGKNTLLCAGCWRRKDRTDFRETPWHGRAASCIRCETFPGSAGRSLWQITYDERVHWELEQAREKLRMWQRFASRLKAERYMPQRVVLGMDQPTSADAFRIHIRPWERVVEARWGKWAPVISEALGKAHTLSEEEAWQTPTI